MAVACKEFKKIKEIGAGAFGSAILVKDVFDNHLYVIKQQHGLRSFMITENEVANLKILNHPNVIKYIKSWKSPDSTCILMEYASGGNLDEHITELNRPLGEVRSMEIFCQIILGLHHIHKKNIIHRDLKPSNIFLDGPNKKIVKIGDFGVSKDVGEQLAQTVIGTKIYMAPEVLKGITYDNKCDLWGSGIILYEMMTNRFPFDFQDNIKMMQQINNGIIRLPSSISEDIKKLIGSLLQKDTKYRPDAGSLIKLPILIQAINNTLRYFSSEDRKIILGFN